jgi:glycosyltransferase involved in cell wall biosynthesis
VDVAEIREPGSLPGLTADLVTVLPPREGFSPDAVGAIGLLVHRLGQPGDAVVGQAGSALTFSGRRFVPAEAPLWPLVGRVDRYMAGVVRSVRRLRPRLVEVHNRANLALRLARACPHARVVLFVHNDPQGMRQARAPADRAALLARLTVVCVSAHLARRFMEGLDPAGPAPLVLPNCLDFAEVPPPVADGDRAPEILFVGRVVANKGADSFVSACAAALPALPGWSATIIGADRFSTGGGQTAFERALLPRARAAGIALRGYVPHAEVLRAMSRAAIVAVPSRWAEPFGLVALEAQACGAALVCSMRGGLPEVVGDAALEADPDAPGALAAAILSLARDPALRARLSATGLARARGFDAREARARLAALRGRLLGPNYAEGRRC